MEILITTAGLYLAFLFHGVYIDHVRRQRRRRSFSRYRTYAVYQQIRNEALGVIGGSRRDSVPEPHLGKTRLP